MIILAQLHKYFTERDAKKANGKEFEIEGFAAYDASAQVPLPAAPAPTPAPTPALQVSTAMGSLKLEKAAMVLMQLN